MADPSPAAPNAHLVQVNAGRDRSVWFDLDDPSDYIQGRILHTRNFYEIDLLNEISRLPIGEGVFCDVGANLGNHTLYFAQVLGRRVHAFEPLPASVQRLRRHVELNRLKKRVTVWPFALGASAGQGRMNPCAGNLGASTLTLLPQSTEPDRVEVRALDDFWNPAYQVALMKIDVEGHELAVLQGAQKVIARDQPVLVIEMQQMSDYHSISGWLYALGYVPFVQRAQTPTIVYVPALRQAAFAQLVPFLIRQDVGDLRHQLMTMMDRMASRIKQLEQQVEALQRLTPPNKAQEAD